mgnify:CR=1 FL=1
MSFHIESIGTAVPGVKIDQTEALEIARALCARTEEQETWLPLMYSGTSIESRHMVHSQALIDDILNGTETSNSPYLPTGKEDDAGPPTSVRLQIYADEVRALVPQAAQVAFEQSSIQPEEITHLVTVSCTGFMAPGVDLTLMQELSLRPTVERTHVGFMGCHGALNGLRVARAFLEADQQARALIVAVELCSLHYHYGWNPQQVIANALFADGAAAVVASASEEEGWRLVANGSCLIPDSAHAMTWTIGDHGFTMTLSKKVPELIAQHLRPWMESWLAENDCSLSEVASWAIHPGGPRILEAAAEALELPEEKLVTSRSVFREHGNMSSPTILFILNQLREQNAPRPAVALGFGPGLVAEAALFR